MTVFGQQRQLCKKKNKGDVLDEVWEEEGEGGEGLSRRWIPRGGVNSVRQKGKFFFWGFFGELIENL